MGQCDSRQRTHCRGEAGGTVRRFLDQPIGPLPQASRVLTNLSAKVCGEPFHDTHSHQ